MEKNKGLQLPAEGCNGFRGMRLQVSGLTKGLRVRFLECWLWTWGFKGRQDFWDSRHQGWAVLQFTTLKLPIVSIVVPFWG